VVTSKRNRIAIAEIAGRADTAAQGGLVYRALEEALARAGPVIVDFEGINTATTSFTNLSFVKLLSTRKLGDIKKRLRVVNSTRQINDMIKSRLEREGGGKAVA
jgi:hypothetical protein